MGFNNELRAKPFKLFYNTEELANGQDLVRAYTTHDQAEGTCNGELNTIGILLNNYGIMTYYTKLFDMIRFTGMSEQDLNTVMFRNFGKLARSPITGSELITIFRFICNNTLFGSTPFHYQQLLRDQQIYGYKDELDTYYVLKSVFNDALLDLNKPRVVRRVINRAVR